MPQFVCVSILKSTDDAVNTIYRVFRYRTDRILRFFKMHKTIKLKKEKIMLEMVISEQFALDIKTCKGLGKDFKQLKAIIDCLEQQQELPTYCCDGPVPGGRGRGNCKVSYDWWLIYKCDASAGEVILERTGSWQDLFGQ